MGSWGGCEVERGNTSKETREDLERKDKETTLKRKSSFQRWKKKSESLMRFIYLSILVKSGKRKEMTKYVCGDVHYIHL